MIAPSRWCRACHSFISTAPVPWPRLARYPEALAAYDRALALDPNSAYAYFNRGVALTEMKRIADAIVSYENALRLVPDYALAAYNRALCLLAARPAGGRLSGL